MVGARLTFFRHSYALLTLAFLLHVICLPQQCWASTPCNLCTRGAISAPEKPISIPGYEIIDSCGTLDAFLPIVLTEDDQECDLIQSISTYCGCPPQENACTLCPDGSAVSEPRKEVPFLSELFMGIPPTCDLVEAFAANEQDGSTLCDTGHLMSNYCGCAPVANHCNFCNGEPLTEEYRDVFLNALLDESYGTTDLGISPTCEALYAVQFAINKNDEICRTSRFITFHCGCNNGVFEYLGAKTKQQQSILVWVPRMVGLLSLMASLLVFRDILSDKKKRRSVYHQIVVVVAFFDCVTSLVWIVGTAAIPEIDPFGVPTGIYGAKGSNASCTAQGFFVQLGKSVQFISGMRSGKSTLNMFGLSPLLVRLPLVRIYIGIHQRLFGGVLPPSNRV